MTTRSLPDDGWREYAVSIGWHGDDLDYVEWIACHGAQLREVIAIDPDAIVLRDVTGETRAIAPGDIDADDAYIEHVATRHRPSEEPDDSMYWHNDEPMYCLRPDVYAVRVKCVAQPCGKCSGCEKFARMVALLPSNASKANLPAVVVDDRLLLAPAATKPKKAKRDKLAPLPGQLGLLGGK